MLDRIGRIGSSWLKAIQRAPRVTPVAPVVKTGLTTGDPTAEQTRYTAQKQGEAVVYRQDGTMPGQTKRNLDLDEPS